MYLTNIGMEQRERKVTKSGHVIGKIKRISGLMDEREYWNFVASTAVITLSVIGVLCYFFV
jgi:hypothetical protein